MMRTSAQFSPLAMQQLLTRNIIGACPKPWEAFIAAASQHKGPVQRSIAVPVSLPAFGLSITNKRFS